MSSLFINGLEILHDIIPEDVYFRSIPALQQVSTLQLKTPITFFTGENGSGKSTMLEAIAVNYGFNAEGGSRNFNFETKNTHATLSQYIRLCKGGVRPEDDFFLRAESFYNVATYVDQIYENEPYLQNRNFGKSLHEQSHGESFLALVLHRFRGHGLYILDEPEAALSPQRQLSLLLQIHELSKAGSQFIIATHSPILLALPEATIYSFDQGITEIDYETTQAYQITEMFINHRSHMLHRLFNDV